MEVARLHRSGRSSRVQALAAALALILAPAPLFGGTAAAAAEGAELIGNAAPDWQGLVWLEPEPRHLADLRGKVVLLRWWTDTCPFCARSAPALVELHERYADRGLVVVGALHPKPLGRSITPEQARAAAERLGFEFPIALDPDWTVLHRYWLGGHRRRATSASFLIDRRGVIRYVHPGPAFHREVFDGDEGPSSDLIALQRAIERLLEEPP